MVEWNCGNGIAEIGWKKKIAIGLWQCHCRNRGEFFFFGNCGNPIVKNGKEKKKLFPKPGKELKKSATSTIFLQYFHNKS